MARDDGVAAEEALRDVVEVHRAAAAAANAVLAAEELRHDAVRVEPARERMPVVTIVRDDLVLFVECVDRADGDASWPV